MREWKIAVVGRLGDGNTREQRSARMIRARIRARGVFRLVPPPVKPPRTAPPVPVRCPSGYPPTRHHSVRSASASAAAAADRTRQHRAPPSYSHTHRSIVHGRSACGYRSWFFFWVFLRFFFFLYLLIRYILLYPPVSFSRAPLDKLGKPKKSRPRARDDF